MRSLMLSLCAVAVMMAGCAERLKHYHQGNDVVERHIIPGSWDEPGRVAERTCAESQMIDSKFWGKKVCPSDVDKNATLSVDRGTIQTASYRDLVVPPAVSGAFFMGGMAILGTQINSGFRHQPQQQGALAGSSISTLNMRGTGPAFQGMAPAPLGGMR